VYCETLEKVVIFPVNEDMAATLTAEDMHAGELIPTEYEFPVDTTVAIPLYFKLSIASVISGM
jgi:hypothetical protein